MNKFLMPLAMVAMIATGAWFLHDVDREHKRLFSDAEEMEGAEENEKEAGARRAYYEWLISRDPRTGKIPENIRQMEMEQVRMISSRNSGIMGGMANNTYFAAGPTQNGGRTRALAFDLRYNGTSNKVVMAGGINGGIFRSTDGGVTWQFVHPSNEVRSVSCFAQDPSTPNTWYAGTGEALGASAGQPNAFVFGYGVFKSTDNGLTWTKLNSTVTAAADGQFKFDSNFDIITNIAVHPTNGDVYVACHQVIFRSKDGGSTWTAVLKGTNAVYNNEGLTDILINKSGNQIYAAFSGRNSDRNIVGVWKSSTGDIGAWTRIAGGQQNQPDSVAGWRAYDISKNNIGSFSAGWGRIALGLSGADDQLYVLVENSLSAANKVSEADLWKADLSASPVVWTDLSSNLIAKLNGTDDTYVETQEGYDLEVAVHPTNPNIVFVGGVNLFRSTDAFATKTNVLFMGGRKSSTYDDPDVYSHVDIHRLRFDPSNPNRMIVASDGGLAIVTDNTAAKPVWTNGNGQYQTFQYYHVGMDMTPGSFTLVGGGQDNSTTIRDRQGIFGAALPDSNDHYIIVGGDGGQATFFKSGGSPYMIASAQEGRIYRLTLFGNGSINSIKPNNTGEDLFVTYFHQDEDNPQYLYYPSNDTLYRTSSASTVTSSSWTRITSVDQAVSGQIFSMATTRGTYVPGYSTMYLGTSSGKIYRLTDPANTTAAPVDITPSGLSGLVKDIAVNPRNHDTVLAVVSNYNTQSVWWTGNATSANPTWQGIEANISVPSARSCEIIATKNGVEYYVGTTVGLFSTTTISGASTNWTRETGGPNGMMNTAVINSIVSRWADNTMVIGTHGNGMFVTNIGNAVKVTTGVKDPIRDDKNFISKAYPTLASNVIYFTAGNLLNIKSIQINVYNLAGQTLISKTSAYGSGSLDVTSLPRGNYFLTITSNDRKYQFIQKFVKS